MAQWAGRASADLHTFLYFKSKGQQSAEAVVTRIRRSGLQVVVPRYGIDGVVPLPEEDWNVNEEEQTVVSKKDAKVKLEIFRRIFVCIEADNTDFRNRTRLSFERVLGEKERQEAYEEMEAKRKEVAKEMYPDRLIPEAN
mmetsp:Transcript_6837/g.9999  ORF Transcript_6837/g.9999 Transcript_6837/m.9999 type:complete len:140 (+) Transcript_6837:32-451(+)